MTLQEWTITFVKNKDLIKQQLTSVEEKSGVVHTTYKDGKKQEYFMYEKDDDLGKILTALKEAEKDVLLSIHVVCYNTTKNLDVLLKNWQTFAAYQRLTFYFANPKSLTDTKWIINPWLHNRVSDAKNLANGLKSMASMVEEWKG